MVAVSGYRLGFAVLAVPGVAAVVLLARLRTAAPDPATHDTADPMGDRHQPEPRAEPRAPVEGGRVGAR
ncbi:MAG TPA: hypothetical protein VG276_07165 [Actinomycetes bacterium]|jgi:hypothetical protein|nr:hypothetical protein [Actinomycetes bacterium]